MKLDFQLDREPVQPKDAATIILVRSVASDAAHPEIEVFCVERSKQSKFMGGVLVFPGGKVDPQDLDPEWDGLIHGVKDPYAIAAERETLEEACMLHVTERTVEHEVLVNLRAELAKDPKALRAFLYTHELKLDLSALVPLSRWITPTAESRRFDARFYVAIAPAGQPGAHDAHETVRSFWASPADVLKRWEAGEVELAPPTHATLMLLSTCKTPEAVLSFAAGATKEPICPKLVKAGDTLALTLPGDPEHDVEERRIFEAGGPSRYVLRGERWLPEEAPR